MFEAEVKKLSNPMVLKPIDRVDYECVCVALPTLSVYDVCVSVCVCVCVCVCGSSPHACQIGGMAFPSVDPNVCPQLPPKFTTMITDTHWPTLARQRSSEPRSWQTA
jgi:hypothetical protein